MKNPAIKPCPFCASPGEIKETHVSHFVVQCSNEHCQARVFPPELSPLAALTVWNTRKGKTSS